MKEPHTQFGIVPQRLPGSQLPTKGDIIGRLQMVRLEKMEVMSISENQVPMKECVRQVASEVQEIWDRASVPTRIMCHVRMMVNELWKRKDGVRKTSKKLKPQHRALVAATAVSDMAELFDISSRCRKPELAIDRDFLADQKGPRSRHIGGVDQDTSGRWQRRENRRARDAERYSAASLHSRGSGHARPGTSSSGSCHTHAVTIGRLDSTRKLF